MRAFVPITQPSRSWAPNFFIIFGSLFKRGDVIGLYSQDDEQCKSGRHAYVTLAVSAFNNHLRLYLTITSQGSRGWKKGTGFFSHLSFWSTNISFHVAKRSLWVAIRTSGVTSWVRLQSLKVMILASLCRPDVGLYPTIWGSSQRGKVHSCQFFVPFRKFFSNFWFHLDAPSFASFVLPCPFCVNT